MQHPSINDRSGARFEALLAGSNRPPGGGTTYRVHYRPGAQTLCPGCGRSHWIVGRIVAECAFCSTAIEIVAGVQRQGCAPQWVRHAA